MKTSIADIKRAVNGISDTVRDLVEQHRLAVRDVERLESALEPVDRIIANMRALVDEQSASWLKDRRMSTIGACSASLRAAGDGDLEVQAPNLPDFIYMARPSFTDLIGLFPEQIKARLEEVIRAEPIESPGPIEKRKALLQAARARVRKIEDEHEELCDAAATLQPPISIALLPSVAERRRNEGKRGDPAGTVTFAR